jgi:hypothetical protein
MVYNWYYTLALVVVIVSIGVLIYLYGKSKLSKDTIALSKDTISIMNSHKDAQDDAIKALQDDASEKEKKISHLSGQVDVLKDIPLRKISESMESLSHSHSDLTAYIASHDKTVDAAADRIIKHFDEHMNVTTDVHTTTRRS